jgi:hypothetical protein
MVALAAVLAALARLRSGRVLDVFVTPSSRGDFPAARRIRAGTRLTVLARTCARTRVAIRVALST